MTTYKSLITPNLGFRTLAGLCLVMAQGITGAPVQNPTATAAANKTRFRHTERRMPRSVAVLWFDHYGRYGEPGREYWDNWGHVVVYVPGRGFASSSPVYNEVSGPYWYPTIEAVERTFNCTYRFWSEDINGKRVCQPVAAPTPAPAPTEEEDDMIFIRTSAQAPVYAWSPLTRKSTTKGYSKDEWNAIQKAYAQSNGRGAPIVTVTPAVFKAMTGRKG